jgi:hypothetical protein
VHSGLEWLFAHKGALLGLGASGVIGTSPQRGGLLLLLGALALFALLIASSSLLRLLTRMNAELPDRR